MKELLTKLEGAPGVQGALVMTLDGVIVASVPADVDHARTAAFLSAVLLSVEKSAEQLGLVPLQRMTLAAGRGRLLLVPVGELALAVLADGTTDLAPTLAEVAGLARRVLRQSKIEVTS
jgi:predicted regulator of Ras-like GTPase activity (Roadblock/LC7/MglB family)